LKLPYFKESVTSRLQGKHLTINRKHGACLFPVPKAVNLHVRLFVINVSFKLFVCQFVFDVVFQLYLKPLLKVN
jgi:hypothetical protein